MTCDHEWGPFRPVTDIRDMEVRECERCHARTIRVLPPPGLPPRGWWDDNWTLEDGE